MWRSTSVVQSKTPNSRRFALSTNQKGQKRTNGTEPYTEAQKKSERRSARQNRKSTHLVSSLPRTSGSDLHVACAVHAGLREVSIRESRAGSQGRGNRACFVVPNT